ncbi:3-oxoacyl-ACP reductase FabG [Pediococcus argentinicus]|uniref:FabG protein n=1 Tax=Pediococcus argentinicus TaxID=480391 RepID=A0A0R2NI66_9LACO|nr:3-oxoacyl-ACP reductase FabG [Pediococcus argentinicus]KRO25489.1 fabG protein [Pediococcus argentinicus]NKZ22183.1 3-oxoacyl-ACP reductase FabG [Pediococcus argentinicus]GEP19232.1 3-oxoacyl-[acyl-carrier-protein] reductase [Pediococcus argentinicus]
MIDKKVALITGGTRGIGLATAQLFQEKGYQVVITARHQPQAEKKDLRFISGDVANESDAKRIINNVVEQYGRLDVLVNNAGITVDMLLSRMKLESFKKVLDVNLGGTFNMTKFAMKAMQKQRSGNIIDLSSISGLNGNIGQANYAASKAGIVGLMKTTAREGALRGIRCNAIAPGMIVTDMTDKLSDKIKESVVEQVPLHRFGNPDEIAKTAYFLADNDYITGQTIVVDGGLSI